MQLIFCSLAMMFYKRYNQLCLWSFNLNSLVLVLGCFSTPAQLQNLHLVILVIYGVNYLSSVPTQPFMFYLNSNNCLSCSFNNKINILDNLWLKCLCSILFIYFYDFYTFSIYFIHMGWLLPQLKYKCLMCWIKKHCCLFRTISIFMKIWVWTDNFLSIYSLSKLLGFLDIYISVLWGYKLRLICVKGIMFHIT